MDGASTTERDGLPVSVTVGMPASAESTAENEVPSCQGCRRRKLRCSREQPICLHCKRLESPCVYDIKKNKPGIKPGAVGNLSRRVDALEEVVFQKEQSQDGSSSNNGFHGSDNVVNILATLARELQKLNSPRARDPSTLPIDARDHAVISPTNSHTSSRYESGSRPDRPSKRRRVDSCGNPNVDLSLPLKEDLVDITTSLPPADVLEETINVYFEFVQPWIPIIHETQFRRRIHNPEELPHLVVVLHAMVTAAIRFVDPSVAMSADEVEKVTRQSRNFVTLTAMEKLSVENLQALIILAFNDIGYGEASKAWSNVGSLTRTVEYLQLSVETDAQRESSLLKPLSLISPARDWTEEEQRRRVFWNVFCLDRFCSVTTGWHTSLTSDDVQRRLPADGGLWHKEEPVTTPYFGIWDRSVAKIGHSIAFLPGNYPSPETADAPNTISNPSESPNTGPNHVDMTTVGAFAYCIEATESLSRITTYFLQQKINFNDRQEVSQWLTRFKELDLRLVHWKMFLPQRWKDSNISRQSAVVNMDPNLTLAHVTHNTSMILLHQRIAYPNPEWESKFKLPSFCSAETCQVASVETASITQKYLKYTSPFSPVTSQFTFCVFISARVLLVQWRHYKTNLAEEFYTLLDALDEMAKRWIGPILAPKRASCLASVYASHLRTLHAQCEADPGYEIDVLGYASDAIHSLGFLASNAGGQALAPLPNFARHGNQLEGQASGLTGNQRRPQTEGVSPGSRPNGTTNSEVVDHQTIQACHQQGFMARDDSQSQSDGLAAISHTLLNDDFLAMDRIISLDDMIFAAPVGSPLPWMTADMG